MRRVVFQYEKTMLKGSRGRQEQFLIHQNLKRDRSAYVLFSELLVSVMFLTTVSSFVEEHCWLMGRGFGEKWTLPLP